MAIDYRQVIENETHAMAATVAGHPVETRVPGCPDWNLGELAIHLGQVQRWATGILAAAEPPTTYTPPPEHDGSEPADYLLAGLGPLLTAIDDADLTAPTWTFVRTEQTKAFWLRRQAMEVATHRWDADHAVGLPTSLAADVAADSIDEYVHLMMPRIIGRTKADLGSLVGDVHIHCTDIDGEWTFDVHNGALRVTKGHGKASTAVRGRASDVALFLYNRLPAEHVEIFGDHDLLAAWRSILRF